MIVEKMITNKNDLEQAVREELRNSQMSVYKLANKTDVSKTYIHDIITENRKPSLEILMKIAERFNIKYLITNMREKI